MNILIGTGFAHVDDFIREVIERHEHLTVVGRPIVDRDFAVDMVEQYRPDVLLIGQGLFQSEPFIPVLEQMLRVHPKLRIIFLTLEEEPEALLYLDKQLFQLGIYDILVPEDGKLSPEQIEHVLFYPSGRSTARERIMEREAELRGVGSPPGERHVVTPPIPTDDPGEMEGEDEEKEPSEPGPGTIMDVVDAGILAVWSPRSGEGVTTLAANLAWLLAERAPQQAVLLVDANLRHPHLHLHFGLYDPLRTMEQLYEIIHEHDRSTAVQDVMLQHPKRRNLHLVTGNFMSLDAHRRLRDIETIRRLVVAVRLAAPYVIVDCGEDPTEPITASFLQASRVVIVPLREDPASLLSLARSLKPGGSLGQAQVITSKLHVGLVGSKGMVREFPDLVHELTGLRLDFHISDWSLMLRRSAFAGLPLTANKPPREFVRELETLLPASLRGKSGSRVSLPWRKHT